jgi:hypothetical protein
MNTSHFPFHFKFEMRHDPSRRVYEVVGTGMYTGHRGDRMFYAQTAISDYAMEQANANLYDMAEMDVMQKLLRDMMDYDKRIPKPL